MTDFVYLGPAPDDEECAQIGQDNFRERATQECRRYIALLRKTFGDEPDGARLAIKWEQHDFGPYPEVVCRYNDEKPASVAYAFHAEAHSPTRWEDTVAP